MVKNPHANEGDVASIPGLGRFPGEGNDNLLQDFCLAGYSPRGCKRVGHDLATKQQTTTIKFYLKKGVHYVTCTGKKIFHPEPLKMTLTQYHTNKIIILQKPNLNS